MTNYEELEKRSNQLDLFIQHLERLNLTEKSDLNFYNLCKDCLTYIKNPYSSKAFLDLMPLEIKLYKDLLPITTKEQDKRAYFEKYSTQLIDLVNFTISCVNSNTL